LSWKNEPNYTPTRHPEPLNTGQAEMVISW
jgi:hypothetical protein